MSKPETHGLSAPGPDDYKKLLENISTLIETGRRTAVRQINTILVATYWLMGRRIVTYEQKGRQRAEYGDSLMERLSKDLMPRFGKGFSDRNLKLMRQFYIDYPIRQTLSAESGMSSHNALEAIAKGFSLSWSHYCLLVRIDDLPKRNFYEQLSIQNNWVVRQLDREINALLYERTALSKRKELVLAKANRNPITLRPEDEIKDSYILDFLDLKDEYSETDLEDAMVRHMERFLLELGCGFAFIARQKKFKLDGDDYRIDLILFHMLLKCYVILELKTTRFTHSHAGQMNLYLNWAKDCLLPKAENDPLGIILCSDKRGACVKYATGGMSNSIFVAKYQLQLPSPEDLQRELERGRDLFMRHQITHDKQPD